MTIIACLGDSITFGEGDAKGLGWVGRLNAHLQRSTPGTYGVYNLGISGDRLANACNRYYSEVLLRRPDLVLIAIGTNDCQRAGHDTPDERASGVQRLFHQWQRWTKYLNAGMHKTVVLGVLPSDESHMPYIHPGEPNNWVLQRDLKEYNDALKAFCLNNTLPFIDFWPHFTPDMCKTHLRDGLHPNDIGYDWMFQFITDFLVRENLVQESRS